MEDIPPIKPIAPVDMGKSRHSKYINILSKVAIAVEPVAQARITAALVYKNEIISFGINQRKSHPFQAKYGKNEDAIFLHAENDAIINAIRNTSIDDLSKCSLYVCRTKKFEGSYVFGLARPCSGCTRAIASVDIQKVYYSLDMEGYCLL